MELRTRYLGLDLPHPFMPGASPMADDLDLVRRLEDAGAAAIVMPSLFEEDILERPSQADRYLDHLSKLRQRVGIPVIASLNGTLPERWLHYARLIERAGASALELNFYHVATNPCADAAAVERRLIDIVAVLKESVGLPLAVKLSPFYSSLPHLAAQLDRIGADGLVLFNRFYQPDIDPIRRQPLLQLEYSTRSELRLRLQWAAILSSQVKASIALTGGIHLPIDAVKAVMAGATVVQQVSTLMQHGPRTLTRLIHEFDAWGDAHGYASIDDLRGCMNLAQCPNPETFERGNYIRIVQSGGLT